MKKIKLILNPKAGEGQAVEIAKSVEEILEKKRAIFSLDSTYRAGGATLLAKKAVKLGFDIVAAIGGDGTVNEVINGLIGSKVIFGVIPAGLKNNLAKSLGIPLEVEAACEALFSGVTQKVDIGKINERYFISGVSLGVDAELSSSKKVNLKNLLKTLLSYKPEPVSLKFEDGRLIDTKMLLLSIANAKDFGGCFQLLPQAKLEDRLLDVCLVGSPSRFQLLTLIPKILKAEPLTLPYSTKLKTKDLWIDSPFPLPIQVDGEILPDERPYHIHIFRQRINVLTPKV